ncbi:MAG: hypothetical protein KKD18_06175, partial [Nanoarchaeota archaeon]|nr:hypothetical protein [Nanoarchaeota archaeon]
MFLNKKGDEKYLSPWNILIWIILIGTIVIALGMFNSAKTDIRSEEARILAHRVIDCIIQDGKTLAPLTENFDLLEKCNLNKKIIEESGAFYIGITLTDLNTNEIIEQYSVGDKDLKFQCALKKDE